MHPDKSAPSSTLTCSSLSLFKCATLCTIDTMPFCHYEEGVNHQWATTASSPTNAMEYGDHDVPVTTKNGDS